MRKVGVTLNDGGRYQGRMDEFLTLETLVVLPMAFLTPMMLYGTALCTMPLSFSFHFLKVHIKRTSKKDQRQLLPVVKHLRTDGPQPIVLTSDAADGQRLAAGGRPGADGVRVWVGEICLWE